MTVHTITIAWVETVSIPVAGQTVRSDLGELPKLEPVSVPRAAVWLLEGTEADVEKARRYAAAQSPSYTVAVWPVGQPDVLDAARAAVSA